MVNVLPSDDYRRLAVPKPAKLPRARMRWPTARWAGGTGGRRQLEALRRDAARWMPRAASLRCSTMRRYAAVWLNSPCPTDLAGTRFVRKRPSTLSRRCAKRRTGRPACGRLWCS